MFLRRNRQRLEGGQPGQFKKPYALMGRLLREQSRDIVFNLCQYGMGNVREWGAEVDGHCWRTAGDLGFELDRIFEVALRNAEHRARGRAPANGTIPITSRSGTSAPRTRWDNPSLPLSASEQYAFMSLWCLSAAPLFFSGDMGHLDEFTLNILCNPEVIAIDQDPLGQCGQVLELSAETFLMVKDLTDGPKAVGLFNRSYFPTKLTATWSQLGLTSRQPNWDLWRQQGFGTAQGPVGNRRPRAWRRACEDGKTRQDGAVILQRDGSRDSVWPWASLPSTARTHLKRRPARRSDSNPAPTASARSTPGCCAVSCEPRARASACRK